jgi:glycosyltransferase involved in cell wall biosynthesis
VLKVAYFTNIAPHYRRRLWLEMLNDRDIEFHFFYGKSPIGGIREIEWEKPEAVILARLHKVKNVRFKSILGYQVGVLYKVIVGDWDTIILLGDMYVLSNWLAALLAKISGKKVYFWGHGLYGNETRCKLTIRKLFLSLADGHFLYGKYAKVLMQKEDFEISKIHVVYNSLDYDFHKSIRNESVEEDFYGKRNYFENNSLPLLIFVGRLTPEKKLHELLVAMVALKARGMLVNLLIIGDGKERPNLERSVSSLAGQLHFYGACYDEYEIGKLLANADLCVSPGNVGLTAIHSLSFGTPVCTHDNMSEQMPEAEAISVGKTGILYSREKGDLDVAIGNWLTNPVNRNATRENCYEVIDNSYNPHVQVSVFRRVLLRK